ncbi:OmpW family protein [Oceanicoccus sp. KOV_DT_Chl]|uniref:OmpW/AlkL family protein n=1 Tax=Oceanicoccus sp. KOV_DT_Chl TaxID=1904639 RepID=UPI000C7B17AD|nr:OmpW family outer membrane protein [Oceanicoccus sp. KOV_DT_Chl]
MEKNRLVKAISAAIVAITLPCASNAHEQGDWVVRVGLAAVTPDESSSTISTTATGPLPGTEASVDNDTQLGLNIVYMWSDNIGIELLAASPFEHDIQAKGLDQYLAVGSSIDLGSTKHLPPTLSAQYYFGNKNSQIRPYVGIGINYTTFFGEDLSSDAEAALAADNLKLDDSVGLATQAGVDWILDDQWLLNASVWHMDIDTEASFDSALGEVNVDVDIDPWAYMISIGYTF